MHTAAASLFVAAVSAVALILTGSTAIAQPPDTGATITPYEQCEEVPPATSNCSTGVITLRQTDTPSGNRSVSVIDNGRFETLNAETGCTTTGSYHTSEAIRVGPEAIQRVVVKTNSRQTVKTRCGDRILDSQCVFRVTTSIVVLPDEVTITSRVWSTCDPLVEDPGALSA